ncbi:MAG TPA: lipoprotein-releasing ABC transporter permease subunit, partial [Caulobacteraceae bacterium]|nr:lipoprotein-releasing ABC transporter permease subunit [Caulobacteraceae bacterium]
GVALISTISFILIMLAVAILIIVMSVMNGFRTELLNRILGFNGHMHVSGMVTNEPELDLALARIRAVPGVVQAVPVIEAQALVQGRGQSSGAVVRGMRPEDVRSTPFIANDIKSGSLQGFGQGDDGGDLILVGSRLAAAMGVEPGDTLMLTSPSAGATVLGSTPVSKAYTVAGTFTVGMSQFDESFIYMPLQQAQLFFGRGAAADAIQIMVDDPDRTQQMRAAIQRAVGPDGVVSDWRDQEQAYFNALEVERTTMTLIMGLLVLIAAANIISCLIMLVKNKGRDIAVLRTLGAGQGAILRIFFLAGSTIGAIGTAAGLLLGILFCLNIEIIQRVVEWATGTQVFNAEIYFLAHIPARIDWTEVAGVAIFSLGASFLATLPPAFQAARLDPVEALRFE